MRKRGWAFLALGFGLLLATSAEGQVTTGGGTTIGGGGTTIGGGGTTIGGGGTTIGGGGGLGTGGGDEGEGGKAERHALHGGLLGPWMKGCGDAQRATLVHTPQAPSRIQPVVRFSSQIGLQRPSCLRKQL